MRGIASSARVCAIGCITLTWINQTGKTSTDDQHANRAPGDDFRGHRAGERALQGTTSVRPHDDQVTFLRFRDLRNDGRRLSHPCLLAIGNAGALQQRAHGLECGLTGLRVKARERFEPGLHRTAAESAMAGPRSGQVRILASQNRLSCDISGSVQGETSAVCCKKNLHRSTPRDNHSPAKGRVNDA